MQRKALIVTNSSLPHIEESDSFKKAIQDGGGEAEVFVVDDRHVTRELGFRRLISSKNLQRIWMLASICMSNPISSLILTAPIPLILLLIPILKFKHIKLVYTLHEPFMPERTGRYYQLTNIYHRVLIPHVSDLIFYSENARVLHNASKLGYLKPCHVVPLYKYRVVLDEINCVKQRKYISFLGNIGSNKDLSKFFDIAEKLPSELFLLAGSGELKGYESRIERLDNLRVINRYLTEAEYFSYIDQSAYVILPYSSASQSGVLLDVMCRGGVAVTTDITAFSEVITHGKTGLMFPYDTFCEDFLEVYKSLDSSEQLDICRAALSLYNKRYSEEAFFQSVKGLDILW